MDDRTLHNTARLKKFFPALSDAALAAHAAAILPSAGGGNDETAYHASLSAAGKAASEIAHPTPAMPDLDAASDSQRDFANTVRSRQVTAIRARLAALEVNAGRNRMDGEPVHAFVSAKQADLAAWLTRLASVKSARRILDAKDHDLSNVSPVVADIVAKKLGVAL